MTQGLRRVLRWLETIGAPRIADQLPKLPVPQPRERIATHEESAKILAEASPEMRCFILLVVDCGFRFSEALSAAPEFYDPLHQTITVRTKGGRYHTVPVSPQLQDIFAAARDPDTSKPFVEQLSRHGHFGRGAARTQWEALQRIAGIRENLRIHDLRRTTAVNLYEDTKDLRAVQELLGHKSLSSTFHYLAHRDANKLRPLMRTIWTPHKKTGPPGEPQK